MNTKGSYFDLTAVVPLDEESLIDYACRSARLSDFGDGVWRDAYKIDEEASKERPLFKRYQERFNVPDEK
jgi:hypothetical protein